MLFTRTRFVHFQRAAVECAHRGVGFSAIVHGDERKSTRFAGYTVHHQIDFVDGSMLSQQVLKKRSLILCLVRPHERGLKDRSHLMHTYPHD